MAREQQKKPERPTAPATEDIESDLAGARSVYVDRIDNVKIYGADVNQDQALGGTVATVATALAETGLSLSTTLSMLGAVREQQLIATEQLAVTGAAVARILGLDPERLIGPIFEREDRRTDSELRESLSEIRDLLKEKGSPASGC